MVLTTLLYAVAMTAAKADADASSNDPATSYRIPTDPDGVPLSVTQPDRQPTQEEIQAQQKQQQQKAADDKDWLLRGYEEELQKHAGANGNLYYQLSTDKDLSRLSGVAPMDINNPGLVSPLRTGANGSGINLRAVPGQSRSSPLNANLSKSLMIPLGVTDTINTHNLYQPQPFGAAQSFFPSSNNAGPKPTTVSTPDKAQDPLALQTPGQVAANQNPNLYPAGMDPNLETLPGETVDQARQRLISSPVAELSMPLEVKQPPRALPVGTGGTVTSTTKKIAPMVPVKIEDLNAPTPVNKMPMQSPIRAPIGNPYDIFYR